MHFITKIECESNFISIGGAYQKFKSMFHNSMNVAVYATLMKERKIYVHIIYMSTGGVYNNSKAPAVFFIAISFSEQKSTALFFDITFICIIMQS